MTNILRDNAVTHYFRDTWAELKKVRWPTRQEAQNLTLIVLAVSFAMALILGLLDFFFAWELGGIVSANPINIVIAGVLLLAGLVGFILGTRQQ